MDKRIGAQYYTIRDFCKTLEDFDASCKKVSDMGYKVVQLSGIGDFSGQEVKAVIDKYGLEVACTHRPPQNYLENLDKEIEFHKTIGCKVCGLGAMPGFNGEDETINTFIKNFAPVCEELKKHGLVFGYHNHAFEFEKKDGKFVIDLIADGIASDNLKYITDVYWLAYAGVNPAKFIRDNKGKIACVHFKDLKVKDKEPAICEVGVGNLDWDDIIDACEEAGVTCALVEQDTCEGDPFDSLKISYDFLTGKGFI